MQKKLLFWNGSIIFLHSQVSPQMIASIINISDLNFDTPFKYASSVLSIVVLVTHAIAIGIELYIIRANQEKY